MIRICGVILSDLRYCIYRCRFIDMIDAAALYRLLGDDVRLRLLRLVALERLNVTELTGILGIAQSGVSRHLGLLKDGGLVSEEREAVEKWLQASGDFENVRVGPLRDAWYGLDQ